MRLPLLFIFILAILPAKELSGQEKNRANATFNRGFEEYQEGEDKHQLFIQRARNLTSSDTEKALQYAKSAIIEATNTGSNLNLAEGYAITGEIYGSTENYDMAIENYLNAYSIYLDLNDTQNIGVLSFNIADQYKKKGLYEKSLEFCLKGMEAFEKTGDQGGLSDIYNCMGSLYKYQSDIEKSLDFYNRSLELRIGLADSSGVAVCYNNIGVVYAREGNIDLAEEYYNKALNLHIATGSLKNQAIVSSNLSSICIQDGRMDEALELINRSLELNTEVGYTRGVAVQYQARGSYYRMNGNSSEAIENFLLAYELFKKLGRLENERVITSLLSDTYAEMGLYREAYQYLGLYNSFNDSIFNIEKLKSIAGLEIEFNKQKEAELHNLRDQKTRTIYLASAITLALSFIVIALLFSRQKIRIKEQILRLENADLDRIRIEQDLEIKKQELATNTILSVQRNELLKDIISRLNDSLDNLKKENVPIITNIISELKNSTSSDLWEEFELRFTQVHRGFYENLTERFPDITTNEKRISAFLRLDLSTKEIASITNQSPHSINIARTRLRKKLGLSNTDKSLSAFLSQF